MRLGLNLPQYSIDFALDRAGATEAIAVAVAAERAGASSVWVSDHPFALGPDGRPSGALEPLVLAGALARRTGRAAVGTLVLAATMRTPAFVAHAARSIASASPGRAIIGLGAGWYAPEHRAYGVALPPFAERMRRLGEALQRLGALGPARPEILVGGSSPAVLTLAARHADWWNLAWDAPVEGFRALSSRLDEECRRAGRDPAALRRSAGVTVLCAPDSAGLQRAVERLRSRAPYLDGITLSALATRVVVGTPEECAVRLGAYGADEVVVTLAVRDDAEMFAMLAEAVGVLRRATRDPGEAR